MRVRSMKVFQSSPCDQAFNLTNLVHGLLMGSTIPWVVHCSHSSFGSPFRIPECWCEWLLPLANSTWSLFSASHLPDFLNQPLLMNTTCFPDHWELLVLPLGYKEHENIDKKTVTVRLVKHWKKGRQRRWKLHPWRCSEVDWVLN